jgi:hypothetical protein
MLRCFPMRAAVRWPVSIAAGIVVGVLTAPALYAQATPAPAQPAPQAQPTKSLYVFAADAGAILNFIKPDKTADFEATIARLKEALAKSDKPDRKKQATGWKIFKAAEPGPNGSVIYVSFMDPVVKGADYSVSDILAEVFPEEGQALYKTYSGAFGQPAQNILNLTLFSDLAK